MNLVTLNRRNLYLCLFLTMLSLALVRTSHAQGVSSYDKQRGQMMLDQEKVISRAIIMIRPSTASTRTLLSSKALKKSRTRNPMARSWASLPRR